MKRVPEIIKMTTLPNLSEMTHSTFPRMTPEMLLMTYTACT